MSVLSVEVAWSQILGSRQSQQDSASVVTWPNGFRLLLLADGMGGHAGGEVASQLVINTFKQHFVESDIDDMRERLIDALEAANVAIFHAVKSDAKLNGMGTTLIALVFDGLSIQWLSVGDSPMWLVRTGELTRLNENHSMSEVLAEKVLNGEMTKDEALTSPLRSQLTEAVMGENIKLLDAPFQSMELQVGDCLLLASDGVESCSTALITKTVDTPEEKAESIVINLLNAVTAQQRPKQDNATLIVLKIGGEQVKELSTVQPESTECIEEPSTQQ